MARITLYHNPGCSNSRGALGLLKARNADFEVIDYLKHPLDRAALESILDHLPDSPQAMVRNDKRFKELKLNYDDYRDKDSVVKLLLEHPELMQRPIVVLDAQAMIARPPEKLLALL